MTKSILYIILANGILRESMSAELSTDSYAISWHDSVDTVLKNNNDMQPNIILCHQDVLESNEIILLASLKTRWPESKILVMGPSRPIKIQIEALKHGARGYFDSTLPMSKLDVALQGVLHGEVWVERHVISGLIDELTHIPEIDQQKRQAITSLSPKELETAKLISHGATNKIIAKKMAITERTVKSHLTTIFHKMDIPDRLSLAIFFRDLR